MFGVLFTIVNLVMDVVVSKLSILFGLAIFVRHGPVIAVVPIKVLSKEELS